MLKKFTKNLSNDRPPLLQALEFHAKTRPEEVALIDSRSEITWAQFDAAVARYRSELLALGFRSGDRIGIHGYNSSELAVAFLACWDVGLVTVCHSPLSKAPELQQELQGSGATGFLADPSLYPVGAPVLRDCPGLRFGVQLQENLNGLHVRNRFEANPSERAEPKGVPPGLAAILFSSGTTGIPKGVMHTHSSIEAMGRPIEEPLASELQRVGIVAPLGYITSLYMLAQCLSAGHTAFLLPRFEANLLLDTIEVHKLTIVFTLPPSGCQLLLAAQATKPRDVSSIVYWPVGGDSFPDRILEAWPKFFGNQLYQGYALTEFFPAIVNKLGANLNGSIGTPWTGAQARILAADGSLCPDRQTGEIQLSGDLCFAGYWNDSEATSSVMSGNWFCTGDLGMRDANGYYWFKGRQKQIISYDAEKISPQQVENVLLQHSDVMEAGVIGVPDELHGEVPIGFVRLRPGSSASAEELRAFVGKRIEDAGVPKAIHAIDSFPRVRTGKLDRGRLQDLLR